MLSQWLKAGFPLFAFLLFFYQSAPARIVDQLIVVIDG
jgi:hypothetical protein